MGGGWGELVVSATLPGLYACPQVLLDLKCRKCLVYRIEYAFVLHSDGSLQPSLQPQP